LGTDPAGRAAHRGGSCHPDGREPLAASRDSVFYSLLDPLRNRRRGFVKSERDRPFEALWPCDEYPDAAPERVLGNPALIRLNEVLPGGLNGRLDALPSGSGDFLAVEYSQGQRLPTKTTDVVNAMSGFPGRKAVVLFTENIRLIYQGTPDEVVAHAVQQLSDAASRASVVIHAIDPRGVQDYNPTPADNTSRMSPRRIARLPAQREQ
jgi:hypothetical protein